MFGQEIEKTWERYFLAFHPDEFGYARVGSFIPIENENYIVSAIGFNGGMTRVLRLNREAEVVWTHDLLRLYPESFSKVVESGDFLYFIGNKRLGQDPPNIELYIKCLNLDGEMQWERSHFWDFNFRAQQALVTEEGNILITGFYDNNGNNFTFFVSPEGDSLSLKRNIWNYPRGQPRINRSIQLSQNHFIATGYVGNLPRACRIIFYEFDSNGDSLDFTFINSDSSFVGSNIYQLNNENLLVEGTEFINTEFGATGDAFLAEFDEERELVWINTYGSEGWADGFSDVEFLPNGEMICCGLWESNFPWLVHTDRYGEVIDSFFPESLGTGWLRSMHFDEDRNLVTFGDSRTLEDRETNYFWLAKFDLQLSTDRNVPIYPDKFKVFPAFPNPFNSRVSIQFMLPYSQNLAISVLDINGRIVTAFPETNYSDGRQLFNWNLNKSNRLISSGHYFVLFQSENLQELVPIIHEK